MEVTHSYSLGAGRFYLCALGNKYNLSGKGGCLDTYTLTVLVFMTSVYL